MYYQEACTVGNYKKINHPYKGKDKPAYGYPDRLTSATWDAYTKNPFDFTTRKDFLNTISLTCIDKTKDTKMNKQQAEDISELLHVFGLNYSTYETGEEREELKLRR
jgi:hypothetical protein